MNWFYRMIGIAAPTEAPALDAPQIDVTDEAAATTAVLEIRARCKTILESPAAEGHERLAQHLALNTELSIADALATLSACPRDVARSAQREQNNDFFAQHRAAHPELWAKDPRSETPETVVERMQANYAQAQGLPPRKST